MFRALMRRVDCELKSWGSIALAALLVLVWGCGGASQPAATPPEAPAGADTGVPERRELDLGDAADERLAFLVTRGSTDPEEEVVFYWSGHIYASIPADPHATATAHFGSPILRFEGYNVARFLPVEGGHRMLSREVTVYEDLAGNILDCWNNGPLAGQHASDVTVMQVWNDPVNFTIAGADHVELGQQVMWHVDVVIAYPSPLPVADYPSYSAGNTYESAELFNFYVSRDDLEDPSLSTAPVSISWTRVGQFLPWMQMGQAPGQLIYHARGAKLVDGWDALPERLRQYVEEKHPEYRHAPTADSSPNATSWRRFKTIYDAGEYADTCSN